MNSSGKIIKIFALASAILTTGISNAQSVSPQSVINESRELARVIRSSASALSQQELLRLNQLLQRARAVAQGVGAGPGPGPFPPGPIDPGPVPPYVPTPYPTPYLDYEATCHIDDDLGFDYDQQLAGTITGPSIAFIASECQALANASYGAKGSSGLKSIRIRGPIPAEFNTAICHIDDDPNFDFDQFVIGTIAARDVQTLISECRAASGAFGAKGSSGIKNLNAGRPTPPYFKSGECHIDDDPDFDANQFVVGRIFGPSIQDLIQQCRALALDVYPNGSAGVQSIQ